MASVPHATAMLSSNPPEPGRPRPRRRAPDLELTAVGHGSARPLLTFLEASLGGSRIARGVHILVPCSTISHPPIPNASLPPSKGFLEVPLHDELHTH